jgi:SNF2 family DNA or RNA helicase
MIVGGYSQEAKDKPLRDYQTFAAEWLLDRLYVREWPGAGLFLDPGLGKTRTSLSVIHYLKEAGVIKRALIIAPLRPVYTVWPREIRKWGFPLTNIILHNQHAKAMSFNLDVELVNFEGAHKLNEIKKRWDILFIDESTFVKNWSAKRTKAMKKLVKNIPQVVILTGTPVANSLADLHAQHFMIDGGEALGKTVGAFRSRFCRQGGWMGRKWLIRDGVGGAILDAIKPTCLRMKAEDHLDMPELIQTEMWCQMGKNPYNEYKRLKRDLYTELEGGGDILVGSAAAAYSKCKQFANGQVYSGDGKDKPKEIHHVHKAKMDALLELHGELNGKPLLVFYHGTHDRERILTLPPFKGCPVIAGKMKIDHSSAIIDKWNAGEYHAILVQWQAGSHGLNMQEGGCNDIACVGIPDSPEIYDQAFRRVYRQGVKGDQVRIHRILTLDTVDEAMLQRLTGKIETQAEFLEALKKHARNYS